jgi:hypothetical protein
MAYLNDIIGYSNLLEEQEEQVWFILAKLHEATHY